MGKQIAPHRGIAAGWEIDHFVWLLAHGIDEDLVQDEEGEPADQTGDGARHHPGQHPVAEVSRTTEAAESGRR
jgi:hypothetical protein